jgi:hypothetical protein
MAIGDDFSVAANGDIRHTSGTTNYTVIAFHRWLGDLMDDAAAAGNDVLDITDATASERATDNFVTLKAPYNIDDTASQFLYDGSIVQKNGDEIYDGLVVIAAPGTPLDIIQNGAKATNFWGTAYNADATQGYSHRFMLKVRTAGADIDGRRLIGQTRNFGYTYSEFRIGAGTSRGNNVLALGYATDLNNQTSIGSLTGSPFNTVSLTTAGYVTLDIDGNSTPEPYYSEWNRGSATINQFYERLKYLTRSGETATLYGLAGELFRGITHEVALTTPRSGTFNAFEKVTWAGGTGQMLAIDSTTAGTKMWIQLLTGTAPTTGLITGDGSGATATPTGSTEKSLSFPFCGASTGSAIIGAYGLGMETADTSASDKFTDLNGSLRTPPNNVSFTVGGLQPSEDRVLVTALAYEVAYDNEATGPFVDGETLTFTSPAGTAKLLELRDDGGTGRLVFRMLTGSPPADNSTITGAGGATADAFGPAVPFIDIEQFTLNGTLSGASVTSVVVTEAIPADTPASGILRIKRDSGIYTRHPYSSFNGGTKTFTLTTGAAFNGTNETAQATTGNGAYLAYIDKLATSTSEAFTVVYSADRSLFIRVRDGAVTPIKTFETTGTLGSAGGSSTAIRTSDT